MKKICYLLLGFVLLSSCGPSFCDCVWNQTQNDELVNLCINHLGTEYPSFNRLESVRKGTCEEYGKKVVKRLKDVGIKKLFPIYFYQLTIGVVLLPSVVFSQKIYSVDYQSQSDVKVFVVEYESQSDLKVFKVDYPSQSKVNEGLWYFVDYPSQSDKKIYFVDYESHSDLKVFFVKYKSQSGWRNKNKKHLLY